jgi:ubiquinone/menaquinone biosynthesis C-methylase UbiE
MQRILEPEYMDTAQEAEVYAAMDHGDANRSFVARAIELGAGKGQVLDVGTGPGDIPILLAHQAPEAEIVAIDAAEHMLVVARRRVADAGVEKRITLRRADAKDLPFEDESFDAVISNTILHHIPEPVMLLREAYRVLQPYGVLCIRDLCRPASEKEAWALVDRHARGATDEQQKLLFDSLRASLTLEEARAAVDAAGIPGATVEMSSDRHYTIELKGT